MAKRQARDGPYDWFFVADGLVVNGLFSIDNKGREQIFPLYLYDSVDTTQLAFDHTSSRTVGFTNQFLKALRALGSVDPEGAFAYIYGVVNSPQYRVRYADFLRQGYPRIPLPASRGLFDAIGAIGTALIDAHLLRRNTQPGDGIGHIGTPPFTVLRLEHADQTVWLDRDHLHGFTGISEAAWNFTIGGHRVCHKWLQDRATRAASTGPVLGLPEVADYERIVAAVSVSLRLQAEVDSEIDKAGGWPGAFGPTDA